MRILQVDIHIFIFLLLEIITCLETSARIMVARRKASKSGSFTSGEWNGYLAPSVLPHADGTELADEYHNTSLQILPEQRFTTIQTCGFDHQNQF